MRVNRNILRGLLWAWLFLGTPVAAAPVSEKSCALNLAALYGEPIVAGMQQPPSEVSPRPAAAGSFKPENVPRIQQYTGPEANSEYVRNLALTNMGEHFPDGIAAQQKLLKGSKILQYQEGGIGFTVLLENAEGEVRRYKGLKSRPGRKSDEVRQPEAMRRLLREVKFANEAAGIGVSPNTKFDWETGLMEMENIEGLNLTPFRRLVLSKMEPEKKAAWLDDFVISLTKQVRKLHEANIVHLDLTPGNIMIPKANESGDKIYLIDYGLSLYQRTLSDIHPLIAGRYAGTAGFQGSLSMKGNPSTADDLQAIGTNLFYLLNMAPVENGSASDKLYLGQRPKLRAVMALLNHPAEENATKMDANEYRLLIDAVTLDRGERVTTEAEFAKMYKEQLEKRSEAERLEIMNEEPGVRDIVAGKSDEPEPIPLDLLRHLIRHGQ